MIHSNFEKIDSKFDLIVSNPPYITNEDYENLPLEIKKFEPKIAFCGGYDGLHFYKIFANSIKKIMKKNSLFIFEIGHNQLKSCKKIFANSGLELKNVSKDIQKIERTLTFLNI